MQNCLLYTERNGKYTELQTPNLLTGILSLLSVYQMDKQLCRVSPPTANPLDYEASMEVLGG